MLRLILEILDQSLRRMAEYEGMELRPYARAVMHYNTMHVLGRLLAGQHVERAEIDAMVDATIETGQWWDDNGGDTFTERARTIAGLRELAEAVGSGSWSLGAELARVRKQRGYTQAQVAVAMGVKTRTVRRWESGESAPGAANVVLLLAFLDGRRPAGGSEV